MKRGGKRARGRRRRRRIYEERQKGEIWKEIWKMIMIMIIDSDTYSITHCF